MKYKNFTGSVFSLGRMFLLLLLVTFIYACNKDTASGPPSSLTRLSENIEFEHRDTAVTLRWREALTAWEGENKPDVRYEINISSDPDYEDENQTALVLEIDSPFISLNREQLVPLQEYYARVRSIAGPNEARSGWLESDAFMILDKVPEITVLRPVKNHEITDNVAIVRWGSDEEHEVTHYVLTEGDQEGVEVELSTGEVAAGTKTLEGLTSNQAYTIQLFAGDREMGTASFMTKPNINDLDNVVDLRADADPAALRNTLNTVAEGSTIVLARGSAYTFPDLFALDRSVTIMSEPGFGAPARIEMASSFDIALDSDIDHIVLNDLEVRGNIESTYVMNIGNAGNVGRIVLENCLVSNHRGVIRVKTGPVAVDEITINNSIIYGVGGFGVINMDNGGATLKDLRLTNSTVNSTEVILKSKANGQSITIENVTFYDAPRGAYVVDYNNVSIGVTIRNSLFGSTTNAQSVRANGTPLREVSNSFATSDFSGNLISGVSSYSKGSTQVFADPASGDFTLMDEELLTVGDPRWR